MYGFLSERREGAMLCFALAHVLPLRRYELPCTMIACKGRAIVRPMMIAGQGKKQAGQAGAAQPAEGAGEEAQVSSKPVEWPMVPPGSKRQRSRLHQTPGCAPPGATPEDFSPLAVRLLMTSPLLACPLIACGVPHGAASLE